MVFSSHIFLFYFLPLALGLYYALHRCPLRWRNCVLIVTGYAFYGWAEPIFMPLMFATTLLDWLASLAIARNDWRIWRHRGKPMPLLEHGGSRSGLQKTAIRTSLILNICVLGFFKYFNFGLDSYNAMMGSLGADSWQWNTFFEVILPLGISFYTFQAMSYTIDVYRGEARAMGNLADFSCFVSMFPHLVAGPILKFSFLAGQLESRTHTLEKFSRGAAFLILGLSKKILLANPCGKVADLAFLCGSPSTLDAWFGAVAYAFQIYFDFSAYSDMAIGLGLMLGFVFAKNFNSPYQAVSMTDFWRRWHISLSSWLRDYLYIPLGGNRRGEARTYANLILVMLIGGLWHGASWTFVIWGAIHGGMLALERLCGGRGLFHRFPSWVQIGTTFVAVVVAWVFFRAPDISAALSYCKCLWGLGQPATGSAILHGLVTGPYYVASFALAGCVVWFAPQSWNWTRSMGWGKAIVLVLLFWLSIAVMTSQEYNPFIYFIF